MKKMIISLLLIIFSCFFVMNTNALSLENYSSNMSIEYHLFDGELDDFSHNCRDLSKTIRLGGYIILLVKVALPLVLIVKASLDMFSVITSGKSEELKKKAIGLMYSLIAAVIIFFIPTIVDVIFGFVNGYNSGITTDSKICTSCLFDPFSDVCTNAIKEAEEVNKGV